MTEPDSAAFYDRVAAEYDDLLRAAPGDRWIRDAFRAWVMSVSPHRVFDFGCGTGRDARWYAERGCTVFAYDNSPRMMAELRKQSADQIAGGAVVPIDSPDDLTAPVDIVTANFAVLNHLERLDDFFALAARVLDDRGQVMVSVQNPWFWKELVKQRLWSPGWWRRAAAATVRGHVRLDGEFGPLYQHLPRALGRAARPHFALTRRAGVAWLIRHGRGRADWERPGSLSERWERRLWTTPGFRSWGRYRFLGFERRGA